MALDIVYSDADLFVINKPSGLLSQADETGDPDVVSMARNQLRAPFVGLVHRLDRPASGLMVLALTPGAAAGLSEQFRARTVEKKYLAMVSGRLEGAGMMTDYLEKEDRNSRVVDASRKGAKHASLQWRAIEHYDDGSLLEVMLKTGRSHQIRLQLAHAGHPVLGDFRYGSTRALPERAIALHAHSLRISHPVQRRFMKWEAPAPEWFQTLARERVCR